ncbi:hypothetical protein ONZ45_g13249 [Pleurotus djamor]|nr:hypothetical protein ONZ45_g13249 [Pleurotus djamor]
MISLPPEIILHILSFVTLKDLLPLHLVCKELTGLIRLRAETVYRDVAFTSDFVSSREMEFEDLMSVYSERALYRVESWKDLCIRRKLLGPSWLGYGPSTLKKHGNNVNSRMIHRFKVDELAGYVISTSMTGSLIVSDISSGEILWLISENQGYVRPYAHCEYGQGYIVFDRFDGHKEVWRRACDFDSSPLPEESLPAPFQLEAYRKTLEDHPNIRGHFRPWLLLTPPAPTLAYRFIYPTLLVCGHDQAFLYDIPSGQLIQTIKDIQQINEMGEELGDLRYVELSARQDGCMVLEITSSDRWYGAWRFELVPTPLQEGHQEMALQPFNVSRSSVIRNDNDPALYDNIIAAHVSSCGSHLVVLLSSSRCLVIHDFERAVKGESTLHEITLDIQLGSPRFRSIYLAYEFGRIAVATASGIFIAQPITREDGTPCLQMTDTGLFVNCYPSTAPVQSSVDEFNESLTAPGRYIAMPNGAQVVVVRMERDRPLQSDIYDLNVVPTS